jgi:hypothetical protein
MRVTSEARISQSKRPCALSQRQGKRREIRQPPHVCQFANRRHARSYLRVRHRYEYPSPESLSAFCRCFVGRSLIGMIMKPRGWVRLSLLHDPVRSPAPHFGHLGGRTGDRTFRGSRPDSRSSAGNDGSGWRKRCAHSDRAFRKARVG